MIKATLRIFLSSAVAGVSVLMIVAGCAGTQGPSATAESLFYPPPPAPARLQYLTRYSSQMDLSAGNDGFRDFVFGEETGEGHLVQKPYGLAIFEGAIYVVDTRGGGYAIFDVAGKRSDIVIGSGRGSMQKPINITIDSDGLRYITDTGREQILVYDRNNRFVEAFGTDGQFRPVDVVVAQDRLYVSDVLHHKIQVLDKASGEFLFEFGSVGSDPGELFNPTNLSLGPDGLLYVTDTGNFRVQAFSIDGEFIRDIGQIGTAIGRFARPKGIALDRENRLYVVDSAFENVQILDPTGSPLLFFGAPGDGPGNINLPTVVKVDYENTEYFQEFADPNFDIEYVVLVASQFGVNKIVVFGFGEMRE
jgi:DNA-binding beta-propeller fold protein YncE